MPTETHRASDDRLNKIGKLITTQDNRITSDPIFIVQQVRRDWGCESCHAEDFDWFNNNNGEIYTPAERESLDSEIKNNVEKWDKVYYIDRWEFVTVCFTAKGCQDYIDANGHNLKQPRIYVLSGYHNEEWKTVRNALVDGAISGRHRL